jgi:hypothetical protein
VLDKDPTAIAELRLQILNAMMDDSEDVEQIYLFINEGVPGTELQPKASLREIIDEMKLMLEEGYIKADFSNDENTAPLPVVDLSMFHHYWFSPTEKGKETWKKKI